MSDRFPGGVISKTPPTVTPPVDGEGGSASGMWTLNTVLEYEAAGAWPKPPLPRALYAWGYNTYGRIGDNTTVSRSSPVQIGALTNWSQVSGGSAFIASVKTDGTLWAWGQGGGFLGFGQLGDNAVVSRSSPVQIGALTNWSQVSGGNFQTAAVKTDGTMWAWGRNNSGQIGDNTVINRSSPVQIGALTNWSQVSAGSAFTASVKTDGTMWTWGYNGSGQLGDGTVYVNKSSPVQIGALTNWSQVSAGSLHTAAVKTDGTLWAWGGNTGGRLGDNTETRRSSPVQIGALTNWSQVSAGGSHTAAVKTNGTLWAWGWNGVIASGAIGDNTVINRSSPVQIGALTDWSQVSAGGSHTAAVKTDGTLWAWGDAGGGQVGDNTRTKRSSPVQIGALTNWSQVSGGNLHTAAITKG